jgi:dolichyl-phosphate beta-glucosyltransferase
MLPPDLSVVIPCFNERGRIAATLDDVMRSARARGAPFEVIVVDDGSSDGTADLVEERTRDADEVRCIRLPHNVGKGGAVRAGMQAASGTRRAFIDADGAVPFDDMQALDDALTAGADIAIGSRVADPSLIVARLHRRFAGFFFRALVRGCIVSTVDDTQCGFKLFTAAAADAVFAQQSVAGFAFDVELLGRAERRGLRIAEVGVRWHHQPGSKVRVLHDGLIMVRDVLRIRAALGPRRAAAANRQRALHAAGAASKAAAVTTLNRHLFTGTRDDL